MAVLPLASRHVEERTRGVGRDRACLKAEVDRADHFESHFVVRRLHPHHQQSLLRTARHEECEAVGRISLGHSSQPAADQTACDGDDTRKPETPRQSTSYRCATMDHDVHPRKELEKPAP